MDAQNDTAWMRHAAQQGSRAAGQQGSRAAGQGKTRRVAAATHLGCLRQQRWVAAAQLAHDWVLLRREPEVLVWIVCVDSGLVDYHLRPEPRVL
jgi:hypothetical protein